MKVKINTESLKDLLLPLQAVINDNHVVPILQCVKIEFNNNEIKVIGENLEVYCSNVMSADVKISNSLCVNYSLLMSAIKSVPDKDISMSFLKNAIKIYHKKGEFKFPSFSSKEFPEQEKNTFSKKAKLDSNSFKSAIKVANKFILDDDVSAMGNICIDIGKKVFVRSTDRNRLFEEKIKGKGDEEEILISGKSSVCLFSLIEDSEELNISYNSQKIFFKFDQSEVIVIQQQGKFPLTIFNKVLSCINDADLLKLDIKEFLTSLKRVSIFSVKEKTPVIRLEIDKKEALLSCNSVLLETRAEEAIPVSFKKKKLIGYNYRYLIEILSIFDDEPELYIDGRNCLFIKQKKKIGALSPIMLSN